MTIVGPTLYSKGEADIQIEIRYTAGKDEYETGTPFDPDQETQQRLIEAIRNLFFDLSLSVSVWCKPHYNSAFKMFEQA